jgi:hypothetical protein
VTGRDLLVLRARSSEKGPRVLHIVFEEVSSQWRLLYTAIMLNVGGKPTRLAGSIVACCIVGDTASGYRTFLSDTRAMKDSKEVNQGYLIIE